MARITLTAVLIALLNVLVGCNGIDSGKAQLTPARIRQSAGPAAAAEIGKVGEVDIIERVAVNRQAYRRYLKLLVEHYIRRGNNMKLRWAQKELRALDSIPQYNYIIEAGLAGPALKASASIPDADRLYHDAREFEKKAKKLIIVKDENLLRLALDKYNQLIRKHHSSDKIDDAAYHSGGIYEYFKDYTIALLYYQRAYQWDPETTYPARFKAAYILDKRLHRRAEALKLYRQCIEKEARYEKHKEFAEKRLRELTGDEGGE